MRKVLGLLFALLLPVAMWGVPQQPAAAGAPLTCQSLGPITETGMSFVTVTVDNTACGSQSAVLTLAITDAQFPSIPGFPRAGIPYEFEITQGSTVVVGPALILPHETLDLNVTTSYRTPLLIRSSVVPIQGTRQEEVALGAWNVLAYLFDYLGVGGNVTSAGTSVIESQSISAIEHLVVAATGQTTVGALTHLEQAITNGDPGAALSAVPGILRAAPQWLTPILTAIGGDSASDAAAISVKVAFDGSLAGFAVAAGPFLGMAIVNHDLRAGAPGSVVEITTTSGGQPQQPPGQATLLGPGGGGAPGPTVSGAVSFSWTPAAMASRYAIYISQAPYGAANVVYGQTQISGSATSWTLPAGILPPGDYRWNLEAFNGAENTFSANDLYFEVSAPATGSLDVRLTGLAAGVAAPLSLTGQGVSGSARFAVGTVPFTYLAPGNYTVSAGAVRARGWTYSPAPGSQTVTVGPGATATASVAFCSSRSVNVIVNGACLRAYPPPIVRHSMTLVPVRSIAAALGADVSFGRSTKTVTLTLGGDTVRIGIGKAYATVDGRTVRLDAPAVIVAGSVYVPLRFTALALGATVEWDASSQAVLIHRTPTWSQVQQPPLAQPSSFNPSLRSDGGSTLTSDPANGLLQLVDPLTGVRGPDVQGCDYQEPGAVSAMAPDGNLLLACSDGSFALYDVTSQQVVGDAPAVDVYVPSGFEGGAADANTYIVEAEEQSQGASVWIASFATGQQTETTFSDGNVDSSAGDWNANPDFFVQTPLGTVVGELDSASGPDALWAIDPYSGAMLFDTPLDPSCSASAPIVSVNGGADVASGDCIYSAADGQLVARTDMQSIVGGAAGQAIGFTANQLEVLDLRSGTAAYYPLPKSWIGDVGDFTVSGDGQVVAGVTTSASGWPAFGAFDLRTHAFTTIRISLDDTYYKVVSEAVLSGDGRTAEVLVIDAMDNAYGVFFHQY